MLLILLGFVAFLLVMFCAVKSGEMARRPQMAPQEESKFETEVVYAPNE